MQSAVDSRDRRLENETLQQKLDDVSLLEFDSGYLPYSFNILSMNVVLPLGIGAGTARNGSGDEA